MFCAICCIFSYGSKTCVATVIFPMLVQRLHSFLRCYLRWMKVLNDLTRIAYKFDVVIPSAGLNDYYPASEARRGVFDCVNCKVFSAHYRTAYSHLTWPMGLNSTIGMGFSSEQIVLKKNIQIDCVNKLLAGEFAYCLNKGIVTPNRYSVDKII